MRIHSISTGHVQVHTSQARGRGTGLVRRLNVLRDSRWTPPLPIHAWAIEHPEGLILVDTGEVHEASDPRHFPAHPYYRRAGRVDLPGRGGSDPQLLRLRLSAGQERGGVPPPLPPAPPGGLG